MYASNEEDHSTPTERIEILIIGGGISGLYAACLLNVAKKPFMVLEARDRLGGRILSPEYEGFFSDLGPSWYWPDIQPGMVRLIQALGLKGYRQFEAGRGRLQRADGSVQTVGGYPMQPPTWRIHGGMGALIQGLSQALPEGAVRPGHPVCGIERSGDQVLVKVGELEKGVWKRFLAHRIILALPPRLAAATILFEPDLSHELTQAMLRMGTWMAGQAKFCALYEAPFWRQSGLSGEGFSERGPLCEIHDASNEDQGPYGLTGFVGIPAAYRRSEGPMVEAILHQLAHLYGDQAARPTKVFYHDWARKPFTATQYDQPPMYEHPVYHPPDGRTAMWEDMVHFAGTETAEAQGGYLEGALAAAERAVKAIIAAC